MEDDRPVLRAKMLNNSLEMNSLVRSATILAQEKETICIRDNYIKFILPTDEK